MTYAVGLNHLNAGQHDINMKLLLGDCLERMREIPDGSVDMVMADLPYGTTACKWDAVIPFAPLWKEYQRLCKGAIVLTAAQPFTSALLLSNPESFRHSWVWEKTVAANFMLLKKQPAKLHEDVLVFGTPKHCYNPQMQAGKPYEDSARSRRSGILGGEYASESSKNKKPISNLGTRFPSSIQKFANPNNGNFHPTQKPVALMEYLIRTYTNEGMTVLDNTMGSGTTGVACVNTNRYFIGIERDAGYFAIAQKRIAEAQMNDPAFQ